VKCLTSPSPCEESAHFLECVSDPLSGDAASIPGASGDEIPRTRVRNQAQMYSSAMAPARHLATVTMRAPFSNSPMTHVHSPAPNLIGCDVI